MTPQTFKKGTCKSRYDFKQQKGLDYGKGAGPLLPGGRKFNQISQHYLLYLFDSENLFFRLSCGAEKGLNNATHYGNFLSVHTSFLMPSPQTFKCYEHFFQIQFSAAGTWQQCWGFVLHRRKELLSAKIVETCRCQYCTVYKESLYSE